MTRDAAVLRICVLALAGTLAMATLRAVPGVPWLGCVAAWSTVAALACVAMWRER